MQNSQVTNTIIGDTMKMYQAIILLIFVAGCVLSDVETDDETKLIERMECKVFIHKHTAWLRRCDIGTHYCFATTGVDDKTGKRDVWNDSEWFSCVEK
jgi:hypothetical protein